MATSERILILDVDGVLVTPPDWFGLQIRREAPEAADSFFAGPFLLATRGEVDLLDHLSEILAACARSQTPHQFLAEWHEYENYPDASLCEAVRELRASGWQVYLGTNQEQHRLQHLLEVTGLAMLVDGEFASCSVGHRKPSKEYFAEVTRRLGIPANKIVFFDDAEENVLGALEAGWAAHLYSNLAGFKRAIAELS